MTDPNHDDAELLPPELSAKVDAFLNDPSTGVRRTRPQRDALDDIDEAVARITDADIEDRLRETLARSERSTRGPAVTDLDTLVASLRRWANTLDAPDKAAVKLLVQDETWLHRADFHRACIRHDKEEDLHHIDWLEARRFLEAGGGPHAHHTALTALRLALALVFDEFELRKLGRVHRQWVVSAFADALGVEAGRG